MIIWWLICILGLLILYEWIRRTYTIFWFFGTHRLTQKSPNLPSPPDWPLVSIIVPARNEERGIEQTLNSLLNLDYPSFEVIAVDDRSEDKTGTIMDHLAKQDKRLTVIHNNEIPGDWLGKQYVIHKAVQVAKGDYILLTDGDVIFNNETLKLAMKYVSHRQLDHLVLLTSHIPGGFWENALWTFFVSLFMVHRNPKAVSNPSKKDSIGLGQFNLVKRVAYDNAGGDEAIRLRIPQDMNLGRLLKSSGAKQDILFGSDLIRLKWFKGVRGFMNVTEKNAYATLNFSINELLTITGFYSVVAILPYIAIPFLHDIRIYIFLLSVIIVHFLHGYVGHKLQCGWRVMLATPFCLILYISALWKSAIITIRQGGIKWRERFYSIEKLRGSL